MSNDIGPLAMHCSKSDREEGKIRSFKDSRNDDLHFKPDPGRCMSDTSKLETRDATLKVDT